MGVEGLDEAEGGAEGAVLRVGALKDGRADGCGSEGLDAGRGGAKDGAREDVSKRQG